MRKLWIKLTSSQERDRTFVAKLECDRDEFIYSFGDYYDSDFTAGATFRSFRCPFSVPQLLKAPIPNAPVGKQPVRLLVCGIPQGVEDIILRLHRLGFAEVHEWSPPLPSPVEGEVLRILTRYFMP